MTCRKCAALVAAALLLASCRQEPSPSAQGGTVQVPVPRAAGNGVQLGAEPRRLSPGEDRLEGALKALLETSRRPQESAIPPGTRLRSLKVEGGTATVDLSGEFKAVGERGSTGESLAQNALRQVLAQFPQVERMVVLVDGRPFEGEHADWTGPIPVRDESTHAGGRP